ncbi:MAG: hypothetical protein U0324_20450 [Polyangiales bacterium]
MTAPAAPTDALHTGRLAATALLTAVVTLLGYGAALFLTRDLANAFVGSTLAVGTLLAVALVAPVARLARGGAPLRWPLALGASLAAQALLPAGGALMKLADPLVSSHWRCGTGDVALVMLSPVVAFVASLAAFAVARGVVPAVGARGARVVRGLSLATLAATVALTAAMGTVVAARPQARALLDAIPAVGELPALTLTPAMPVRVDPVGALLVWRTCDENGCDLTLRQPTPPQTESLRRQGIRVGAGALTLRVDRGLDLVVVMRDDAPYPAGAFRLSTGQPVDVTWGTLRGRVAPPLAWFACAALGLLLALVAYARTGGDLRALGRWRGARAATLSADGVVRVDGEPTAATVQGVAQAEPGPVLVFEDAARAPFREASSVPADAVRAGTHADLEAALAVAAAGRVALAAAVAAWSAIPLAVAALATR